MSLSKGSSCDGVYLGMGPLWGIFAPLGAKHHFVNPCSSLREMPQFRLRTDRAPPNAYFGISDPVEQIVSLCSSLLERWMFSPTNPSERMSVVHSTGDTFWGYYSCYEWGVLSRTLLKFMVPKLLALRRPSAPNPAELRPDLVDVCPHSVYPQPNSAARLPIPGQVLPMPGQMRPTLPESTRLRPEIRSEGRRGCSFPHGRSGHGTSVPPVHVISKVGESSDSFENFPHSGDLGVSGNCRCSWPRGLGGAVAKPAS